MMSKEESAVVRTVYGRFMESEMDGWNDIDENIEFFNWLEDRELIKESQIKCLDHNGRIFRCSQDHKQENCFAPFILEAVEAIIRLYEDTGELHEKNRYILTYFLAMLEMKMVFSN